MTLVIAKDKKGIKYVKFYKEVDQLYKKINKKQGKSHEKRESKTQWFHCQNTVDSSVFFCHRSRDISVPVTPENRLTGVAVNGE
jgi:hypothetical protein